MRRATSRVVVVDMVDAFESNEHYDHVPQLGHEPLEPLFDLLMDVREEPFPGTRLVDANSSGEMIRSGAEVRGRRDIERVRHWRRCETPPNPSASATSRLTATSPRCSSSASEERASTTSPASSPCTSTRDGRPEAAAQARNHRDLDVDITGRPPASLSRKTWMKERS